MKNKSWFLVQKKVNYFPLEKPIKNQFFQARFFTLGFGKFAWQTKSEI